MSGETEAIALPEGFTRFGAGRGTGLRLGELWAYRELLYFLVWRDIKVRYKQTLLGAAWAIIQPVLTMVVFTLFFGNLARLSRCFTSSFSRGHLARNL